MKTLDCRGLACPQPVLETKAALQEAAGSFLVIVDRETAYASVRRFAESRGAGVSVASRGGEFLLTIHPAVELPAPGVRSAEGEAAARESGKLAVYVSSAGIGRGDDELGGILMAAFLDTLSHFKGEIGSLIFINGGVRLAVEGSPVLEQIRQIEQIGVEVLVCGTCLNFFGIKDRLAVGSVSNMYTIIETLAQASGILKP